MEYTQVVRLGNSYGEEGQVSEMVQDPATPHPAMSHQVAAPHHLQRGLLIASVQDENALLCPQEQVLV